MKKLILGTVSLIALSGSAMAADLPVHYKATAGSSSIPPIYDWSGFYIGGNAGWGESRTVWTPLH